MLTTLLNNCDFSEPLPEIPIIEYNKYELHSFINGIDTALTLYIDFSHGSGRLGLGQADTLPPFHRDDNNPYRYNFFAEYFEKIDGEFKMVTTDLPFSNDTIHFHGRFPKLEPEGDNKSIRGTIEYYIPLQPLHSDTIMFKVWIIDRDLIESNKVETPVIIVKSQ